jgi:hypothetical protein
MPSTHNLLIVPVECAPPCLDVCLCLRQEWVRDDFPLFADAFATHQGDRPRVTLVDEMLRGKQNQNQNQFYFRESSQIKSNRLGRWSLNPKP